MTNTGNSGEPDIWANTANQPSMPTPPDPAPAPTPSPAAPPAPPIVDGPTGASDPTTAQPATPGGLPPTTMQPAAPGPVDLPPPAGDPGYTTGPGSPPPRQPPTPPTGGPGGPGGPDDPASGDPERPAWLVPAAVGLLCAVVAAGVVFFLTRDSDDSIATDESTTSLDVDESTTTLTETTVEAETTIAPETTVPPETTTLPETTVPETTVAPETTAPPTTTAATTVPAGGITPAAPGTALVAGQPYPIASACVISPAPGVQVTSFLIQDGDPGTMVEQISDEGNVFGGYTEFGASIDVDDYQDLGADGFGMLGLQGDTSFEIALNPGDTAIGDCAAAVGTVRISDPAAPDFGYEYGIVDTCALSDPFIMVGYLTEGGRFQLTDNGDGTAFISFNTAQFFLATDDAAALTLTDDRLVLDGQLDGSTFDGDTTQSIAIDSTSIARRACGEFEVS